MGGTFVAVLSAYYVVRAGPRSGTQDLIIKYVIHPSSCQRLDYNVLTRSHAHFIDFSVFDVTFRLAREAPHVGVHLGGKRSTD